MSDEPVVAAPAAADENPHILTLDNGDVFDLRPLPNDPGVLQLLIIAVGRARNADLLLIGLQHPADVIVPVARKHLSAFFAEIEALDGRKC